MELQAKLFKDGGIVLPEANPTCMRCCETVQTEVVSLPPEIDIKTQRRLTVDVKKRLFSIEQFIQIYPLFLCMVV